MILILRHLQNAVLLMALMWLGSAAFAACIDSGELACTGSKCTERVTMNGTSNTFMLYRSFSLGKAHCNVEHAIIVIHGTNRNGADYFANMQGVVSKVQKTDTAVVIAPQFWLDVDSQKLSSDLYWNDTTTNWRNGLNSVGPSKISSFAVVDQIIRDIVTRGNFPNLKSVVITGHSAGGQFAGRYAIFGNSSNKDLTGVQFSYAPANPSSFTYLVKERPMNTDIRNFAIPNSSGCAEYNEYRYGLEDRKGYVGQFTEQQIRDQFKARNVSYLQGTADTVVDSDMDTSCEAMLQGRNRYERGVSYAAHIQKFLPGNNHKLVEIPGVKHDSDDMYNSAQGIAVLFPAISGGAPEPAPQPPPPAPTPKPKPKWRFHL